MWCQFLLKLTLRWCLPVFSTIKSLFLPFVINKYLVRKYFLCKNSVPLHTLSHHPCVVFVLQSQPVKKLMESFSSQMRKLRLQRGSPTQHYTWYPVRWGCVFALRVGQVCESRLDLHASPVGNWYQFVMWRSEWMNEWISRHSVCLKLSSPFSLIHGARFLPCYNKV